MMSDKDLNNQTDVDIGAWNKMCTAITEVR